MSLSSSISRYPIGSFLIWWGWPSAPASRAAARQLCLFARLDRGVCDGLVAGDKVFERDPDRLLLLGRQAIV